MKFNINAKEILALHNVLRERFVESRKYDEDEPEDSDSVQLKQVYGRLRACLISALNGNVQDPVDSWMKREQVKVDNLNKDLEVIKTEQNALPKQFLDASDFPDDELKIPEYPMRRGHRPSKK